MLNLTLRFTGPAAASLDTMETLELSLNGVQRMAVTTALDLVGYGRDETVRERNYRLRRSAQQMGNLVTEEVCKKLREMGHAV